MPQYFEFSHIIFLTVQSAVLSNKPLIFHRLLVNLITIPLDPVHTVRPFKATEWYPWVPASATTRTPSRVTLFLFPSSCSLVRLRTRALKTEKAPSASSLLGDTATRDQNSPQSPSTWWQTHLYNGGGTASSSQNFKSIIAFDLYFFEESDSEVQFEETPKNRST